MIRAYVLPTLVTFPLGGGGREVRYVYDTWLKTVPGTVRIIL